MRQFINAVEGSREKAHEQWEQTRMIAFYSAFDRKPFKLTDIKIPGDDTGADEKADQTRKQEVYKTLEKWSK
jgi:hypothetical protein